MHRTLAAVLVQPRERTSPEHEQRKAPLDERGLPRRANQFKVLAVAVALLSAVLPALLATMLPALAALAGLLVLLAGLLATALLLTGLLLAALLALVRVLRILAHRFLP
jgi:hypothetical protein